MSKRPTCWWAYCQFELTCWQYFVYLWKQKECCLSRLARASQQTGVSSIFGVRPGVPWPSELDDCDLAIIRWRVGPRNDYQSIVRLNLIAVLSCFLRRRRVFLVDERLELAYPVCRDLWHCNYDMRTSPNCRNHNTSDQSLRNKLRSTPCDCRRRLRYQWIQRRMILPGHYYYRSIDYRFDDAWDRVSSNLTIKVFNWAFG